MNVPQQKSLNQNPPYWYKMDGGEKHTVVVFVCAKGHHSRLRDGLHGIGQGGTVVPSVVCTEPGCGFHENISLSDWDPTDSHQ